MMRSRSIEKRTNESFKNIVFPQKNNYFIDCKNLRSWRKLSLQGSQKIRKPMKKDSKRMIILFLSVCYPFPILLRSHPYPSLSSVFSSRLRFLPFMPSLLCVRAVVLKSICTPSTSCWRHYCEDLRENLFLNHIDHPEINFNEASSMKDFR